MEYYKCNRDESDFLRVLDCGKEREIMIAVEEGYETTSVFLTYENAQKLANELNQLLMEGCANE